AVDAPVPPAGVVLCYLQNQRTDGLRGARPSRGAARVGPAPLDEVGVPALLVARGGNRCSWRRRPMGSSRASAARIARSAHDSLGARAWRWRTATRWRRMG